MKYYGKKYIVSCIVFFHRAATIVLRENNCHFLRVDKENFNRILRDVEANTVRLKEHGQDVLVLEKISPTHSVAYSHFKYVSLIFKYVLFTIFMFLYDSQIKQ